MDKTVKDRVALLILLGCLAVVSRVGAAETPDFAVMEFEMTGREESQENWALGLPDLAEVTLLDQGLPLITRRSISLVLQERKLVRSGQSPDASLLSRALPHVGFLVKGTIAATGPKTFALEMRVLDAKTGTEAGSYTATGAYPDGISKALIKIASEIATLPGMTANVMPSKRTMAGFSGIPEVALAVAILLAVVSRTGAAPEKFRLAVLAEDSTTESRSVADLSVDLAGQLTTVLNIKAPSAGEHEEQPLGSLHFLRGLGFFQSGNHDRALAEFMLCGDMAPDHPTFRHWMGLCYFRLNEFDHARIEFGRFLREQLNSDKAAEAKQLLKECEDKLKDAPSLLQLLSGGRKP